MQPCIELTTVEGQTGDVPINDIRFIFEDSGRVELIRNTIRASRRISTSFDDIVTKAFLDLVAFTDSARNDRRTAVNRIFVKDVLSFADGSAKILLFGGNESFYPNESFAVLSPIFGATSGSGGGGGEVNTMSNLPGGEGIFFQKTGVDFELKSLVAGTNVSFDVTDDNVTVNSTAGGGITKSTISLGVMNLVVEYSGSVPGLVLNAQGDYTLTIPASSFLLGFSFIGAAGHLDAGDGSFNLEIIDTDGRNYTLIDKIWAIGNKSASNQHSGLATFATYDFTVSGKKFTWNNMNVYNPDGFEMVCFTI